MKTTYQRHKNTFSFRGQKSWLVSTNVDMILLYAKLEKPIETSLNNKTSFLNSVLALVYEDKSAIRKPFEKKKFLKNLNQGNLKLINTKIVQKKIISGKNIRGFGYVEQFFVMLSLGIFFVIKVKSPKLKEIFFKIIRDLILDYNSRKPIRSLVKNNKKTFKKLINTFDKLPERKTIIDWDTDKVIFLGMLR